MAYQYRINKMSSFDLFSFASVILISENTGIF